MSLYQVKPPACEPIDLATMKTFLKVDYTDEKEDALIHHLIRSSRLAIEAFLVRSLITQIWRYSFNAGYAGSLADENFVTGHRSRGHHGIELPRSPFIKLEGKIEKVDDFSRREITEYRLDTAGRVARLHLGQSVAHFYEGRGFIEVTFSAGYGEAPEDIPAPIQQAIMMLTAELYQNRVGVNDNRFTPTPLNKTIVELIKPYRILRLA